VVPSQFQGETIPSGNRYTMETSQSPLPWMTAGVELPPEAVSLGHGLWFVITASLG